MDGLPYHILVERVDGTMAARRPRSREERYERFKESQEETGDPDEELYRAVRYEEIATPVFARPAWEKHLAQRGGELAGLGFSPLLFYHNSTYTAAGRPNFTALYLSRDQVVAAALSYFFWDQSGSVHQGHGMDKQAASDHRCLCLTTRYAGRRSVFSISENFLTRYYPEEFSPNALPESGSVAEAVESHAQFIASPPWHDQAPVPWISAADYLEHCAIERELLIKGIHEKWRTEKEAREAERESARERISLRSAETKALMEELMRRRRPPKPKA